MSYLQVIKPSDDKRYFISIESPNKDNFKSEVLSEFGAVVCKMIDYYEELPPALLREPYCFGLNWSEVRALETIHELMKYGKLEYLV